MIKKNIVVRDLARLLANSPVAGSSLSLPTASFSCQGNPNDIKWAQNEPRATYSKPPISLLKKKWYALFSKEKYKLKRFFVWSNITCHAKHI